jgi:CHAT domain-containing protein
MRSGESTARILSDAYARVWAPLTNHLQGASRVIISPDGELNFLPFAALITPDGKYLCEKYEVGYVVSGRDLLTRFDEPATNKPALFGDPAFGDEAKPGDYLDRGVAFRSAFTGKDRAMLEGMHFPSLPGTRLEVAGLERVFEGEKMPTAVYLGRDATKGQVMALNRPEILHLATHGFFLPDVEEPPPNSLQMMSAGERGMGMGMPVHVENPMLRSGLAFTGAGVSLAKQGGADAGKDDGIVTAEEVGSLDLWGTKLVVLSACDTGMGEAKAGQGVMGLRCAFAQAGTRNLMMTLWPVQDEATGRLMVDFYKKYLETDDAIGAINAVQRKAIAQARQKGEQPNPKVWAPFLVSVQGPQTMAKTKPKGQRP